MMSRAARTFMVVMTLKSKEGYPDVSFYFSSFADFSLVSNQYGSFFLLTAFDYDRDTLFHVVEQIPYTLHENRRPPVRAETKAIKNAA